MVYTDKTLKCVGCSMDFIFTAREQAFFADHKLQEPKRCSACRAKKKAQLGKNSSSKPIGGNRAIPSRHTSNNASCTGCGKPLYCRECGEKLKDVLGEYDGKIYDGVKCPKGCTQ